MNHEAMNCSCGAVIGTDGLCPRCSEDDGDPWTPEELQAEQESHAASAKGIDLSCPRCGARVGEGPFVYVEMVAAERDVMGFGDDGALCMASEESIAMEDPGADAHLECRAQTDQGPCLARVELPEDLQLDWG